jgi:hypothetical protein
MEKCKTKLIPKLVKESRMKYKNSAKKTMKRLQHELKTSKGDAKKHLNERYKFWKKEVNHKYTKKEDASAIYNYESWFCNPGCKDTTFQEDIDFDKFVKCNNSSCNKKELVKLLKSSRKSMRKGRTKLLSDDGFYHAFDKTSKLKLIKDGALSGCIVGL